MFAFVLGLAFLLLLLTFRSIVIPIKAIVLNLLSVGAAYGVLVWIFQYGHLEGLLNFHSNGGIVTWLPLFLFTVLFGLSMDYHVFILSRVKELVDRGVPTDEAVARGIRTTASTVTSAAAVMVAVFAIFATLQHARHQADGRRPRRRGAARRDDHPRRPAAGGDEAARRLELVPAAVARVAAAPERRGGAERAGAERGRRAGPGLAARVPGIVRAVPGTAFRRAGRLGPFPASLERLWRTPPSTASSSPKTTRTFLTALESVLAADGRFAVAGRARNGRECLDLAEPAERRRGRDGHRDAGGRRRRGDAAAAREQPDLPVVAISGHDYEERVLEIRAAGAQDYVRKSRVDDDLVGALVALLRV